ncbi:MliC family protein [Yersinia alsatica]|uniref:MliC family protein n=1 Tax=Yersinia alsatica TaxID=2890317 RepID=A0ABY5UJV5_9GAMM|nr:MliC family protein [Yersinia alsatica]OWF70529.1 lysozyme inhibitor [Yersinia frederiksenii]UWM43751.1 MliC family protein [Yersinia alsatica]CNK74317.1 putative lipoprotein [Yersinia frederiksenii]CNK75634.1 putative lipoprotein [Yersinia frederiksenii]
MKRFLCITAVMALAGCSLVQPKNETLHYQCGTTKLTVMQDNKQDKVSFVLDGEQLTLPQVRAASGSKYSDGHYTFWSKGNSAFVERGDKIIINDCVLIK